MKYRTILGKIVPIMDNGEYGTLDQVEELLLHFAFLHENLSKGYLMEEIIDSWLNKELEIILSESILIYETKIIPEENKTLLINGNTLKDVSCVYMLSYIDNPTIIKIGRTTDFKQRIGSYFWSRKSKCGINLHALILTNKGIQLENIIHNLFREYSVDKDRVREWFELSADNVLNQIFSRAQPIQKETFNAIFKYPARMTLKNILWELKSINQENCR